MLWNKRSDSALKSWYNHNPLFHFLSCDIVVAGESDRESQYYRSNREIKDPKRLVDPKPCVPPQPKLVTSQKINDFHRKDEQLSVQLECKSHTLKPLKHRYLRCSSQSTVLLLKKFVAAQLFDDVSRCNEVRNSETQYL